MTEAMPFLQKAILLSYDPWPFSRGIFSSLRRLRMWGFQAGPNFLQGFPVIHVP